MKPIFLIPSMSEGFCVRGEHDQDPTRLEKHATNPDYFNWVGEMLDDMTHYNGIKRLSRK